MLKTEMPSDTVVARPGRRVSEIYSEISKPIHHTPSGENHMKRAY